MELTPGDIFGIKVIIYVRRDKPDDSPTIILTSNGHMKILDHETVRLSNIKPRDKFYNPIVNKLINNLPWNVQCLWFYPSDPSKPEANRGVPPILVLSLPHAFLEIVTCPINADIAEKDLGGLFKLAHSYVSGSKIVFPIHDI